MNNDTRTLTVNGTRIRPDRFSTLSNAWRNIDNHKVNPGRYTTVLGDDNRIWVVTAREAAILSNAGFTRVNRRGETN